MKRNLLAFALLCLSLTATAQTTISQYHPGLTTEGAVYALPKTAVRVAVEVERTIYTPGQFAVYAQRYLRLPDVKLEASTTYRITGLKQTPVGMADEEKLYAVKFNEKSSASNIILADDGRLLAINVADNDEWLAALMADREPQAIDDDGQARRDDEFFAARQPQRPDPRQYLTEEILAAGSVAKMAELTAREIYDLRENRNLLIKGQADFMPTDGLQLQLMLSQLNTQEQALTSLFSGTTTRDTTTVCINYCPMQEVQDEVLFRFSETLGFLDADDLGGTPYYIYIDDKHVVPPVDEVAAAKQKKKVYDSGIYVNIPGRMRSTIKSQGRVLSALEMPAAQFGNVELLSPLLFNKRYVTRLWINPTTGALDRMESESER